MKKGTYQPLVTVDGKTLMDRPLQPLVFVVDTLISQGLYVMAGSPKVGKSWFALWLTVTVAKGEPVWGMPTKQGTTLYLCLEDSERRIQNRLFSITEDAPANAHFCIESLTLEHGLEEQLEQFLAEHPDTTLIASSRTSHPSLSSGGRKLAHCVAPPFPAEPAPAGLRLDVLHTGNHCYERCC